MSVPESERVRAFIGNKECREDVVTAWPVIALAATLDRDDPEPRPGDAIPPGWHWLYFLEAKRASDLGRDGHPRVGGFLPDTGLPRRMWAGGRFEFRQPLRVGDRIRRESEIVSIEPKEGHSGKLVFVTVRHTVAAATGVSVVEEHDIVYREEANPGRAAPAPRAAPAGAAWRRELVADPVMLFRYSALTFIGQRIHYDLDYCREVEGYPGLVVHGPLQALLLLDLCRRHDDRGLRKFEYRALHPVFHFERFSVNGNPSPDGLNAGLWTANAAGALGMQATACFG